MAIWRVFRGWSAEALAAQLERAASLPRNFAGAEDELTGEAGWHHYHSEAVIAHAADDACFERARTALANYQFSDPDIVVAHFDPTVPLLHRRILLEIKVLSLRYICPCLVSRVRDETSVFGFRYDTLEGHIERGMEWFLLTRDPDGRLLFRIEARWQLGQLPNWWSRVGFLLLGRRYQRRWHRRAHRRMSLLAHTGTVTPPRDQAGLTHQGVDVTFIDHA